jgi:hypothetical protein
MSDVRGVDSSNSESVEQAVAPNQDTLLIRPVNSEDSAAPCTRSIVEEPHASESHVRCEVVSTPVRMEGFPFQYSPFVTMHRGSSGRRSRCKYCVF